MKNCIVFENKRIFSKAGEVRTGQDAVLKEHVLQVFVNETPVFQLVCTNSHLKELAVGRLFTEGMIDSPSEIDKLLFCSTENRVRVFLNHEIQWEEWNGAEPSCCTANRVLLSSRGHRPLSRVPALDWKPEWIYTLAEQFLKGADLHRSTQGTHSCFLSHNGTLLFSAEDIGRHNAIDKVVGYALLHEIPLSECILYTSGRVPLDMVQKVIAAGVPVLATKATPTEESLLLAKEYGLTLICRSYPDQFEIYEVDSEN